MRNSLQCQAVTSDEFEITNFAGRPHKYHGATKLSAYAWKLVLSYRPNRMKGLVGLSNVSRYLTRGYCALIKWQRRTLNMWLQIQKTPEDGTRLPLDHRASMWSVVFLPCLIDNKSIISDDDSVVLISIILHESTKSPPYKLERAFSRVC